MNPDNNNNNNVSPHIQRDLTNEYKVKSQNPDSHSIPTRESFLAHIRTGWFILSVSSFFMVANPSLVRREHSHL